MQVALSSDISSGRDVTKTTIKKVDQIKNFDSD